MPGIVVFKRRWSVGSDDLVVPAAFLVLLHLIWVIVLGVILSVVEFDSASQCAVNMKQHVLGYLVILSVCLLLEAVIALVAMRGSILETEPRNCMQYLLYIRLVVLVVELAWLIVGVVWVSQHFNSCPQSAAKRAILGIIVFNWVIMLSVLLSLWCTFDTAGRSWVKMKNYQASIKERETRAGHKRRSGSRRRNWRHRAHSTSSVDRMNRKAMRAYEESWDRRCKILFCCVQEDRHRNSFTEVAKLFTEFFRDLDVVPTDVVAGLVLLRKHQKMRRKFIVSETSNEVYQFLSGVPIYPATKFLSLKQPDVLADYKNVIHYMRYALAAYGWPMYMMMHAGTGLCRITPYLRCCCLSPCRHDKQRHTVLVDDNCCQCNVAALKKLSGLKNIDLVYVTYHVDIGETPFFIAVDHDNHTVVISIRGTLSLQDVLTDLKADAEQLPVDPVREDWLGHKGMVQAAVYIKKKIKEEMLLSQAFGRDLDRGSQSYELVLVGHSLGAGTAAILAILLHQEYPNLHCYAYSPPGGLLSATAVEETKSFITSVVVGKDVVPRIGLHQLETLRQDLINVIKKSTDPKWKIIAGTMCCCKNDDDTNDPTMIEVYETMKQEKESRNFLHPSDSQIALTTHTPLYPPGKIIHIVRNHPKDSDLCPCGPVCGRQEPVYQAIWAENIDFDEVLISPTMVNDHMPDNVMDALQKVLVNVGPAKPSRKLPESERKALLSMTDTPSSTLDHTPPHRLYLESSFTHEAPPDSDEVLLNRCSGAYSLASDSNSLSWDYGAGGDIDRMERHLMDKMDRAMKAKSFPAAAPPRPRPGILKLDMGSSVESDWGIMAPLASPETLSDASSVDSGSWKGSKKFNGYQKLTTGMPTMAPIQQSPLRSIRAEGYHYFVSPPSPVDYGDSPVHDFSTLSASVPLAQSTPMKDPNLMTEVAVEPRVQSPPKPPRVALDMGCNSSPEHTDLPETECNSIPSEEDSPETTFDMTAEEATIKEKITRSESRDNYKLIFEDETNSGHESFVRHSPDSPGPYGKQLPYDAIQGHYSHAGRGYPHGFFSRGGETDDESSQPSSPGGSEEREEVSERVECVTNGSSASPETELSSQHDSAHGSGSSESTAESDKTADLPDILQMDNRRETDSLVRPPRLKPYRSFDQEPSNIPELEFGKRLSLPHSDNVFITDSTGLLTESKV